MLKKNDVITLKIEDMGSTGEGIGKVDSYPVFIKDAIPGDVAEVKVTKANASYGYGRLQRIIVPSPDRTEAKCPIARRCGGCQLQEMSYNAQLRYKEKKVREALKRIGKVRFADENADEIQKPALDAQGSVNGAQIADAGSQDDGLCEFFPIIGMDDPFHYRNKAQFPVGYRKGTKEVISGFYAGRTHDIIETDQCLIGHEKLDEVAAAVRGYMKECGVEPYDEKTGRGLVRHILARVGFRTGEVMACLVINGSDIPKKDRLISALRKIEGMASITINVNRKNTNIILGEETLPLWGNSFITDYIGDVKFQISPRSFFQVNPVQTEKLYRTALEFAQLTGNEVVWDLYCGIGTISLFLARSARQVYGVEIVPEAVADARKNARLNGIENVEFFVGKAEEILPGYYEGIRREQRMINAVSGAFKPDVICVDPPRKGCEEKLLETMVRMAPKRIVYVSCDPATLARDVKYLAEHGYEPRKVQPVEQFGESWHVECVALMSGVEGK